MNLNYFNKLRQTDFASRKQRRICNLDAPESDWSQNPRQLNPNFDAPLISVVLPVFNHARYIASAIQSVLFQNVPLELIIVDDGSTDDLQGAVTKFLTDKRVKFIRKVNGGLASALNLGFEHASAYFLTWTSADNLYLPDALLELANTLIENPLSSLAYGNVELIDEKGKLIKDSAYRVCDQTPTGLNLTRESQSLFLYDDNFINSCFLYRRSFASLAGRYNSRLNGVEDFEYWLKLSAFAPATHTKTNRALYQYRLHSNTLTSSLDSTSLSKLTRQVRISAKMIRDQVRSAELPENLNSAVGKSALDISPLIARSRDSDFKSVPEVSGSLNAGIIYQTGEKISLDAQPNVNFSIYSMDKALTPESIGVNCASVFNDHPESIIEDFSQEEYRYRSLMFYLSRMDFLILPTDDWQPEELRYKAALAAGAGIELRVIRKDELPKEDLEFLGLFLPAKHITFYNSLAEACSAELALNLSRRYFDSWLHSQGYSGIAALVKTGIVSKRLEKVFS